MNTIPTRFADKLLPNQHEFCNLFAGEDFPGVLFDVICRSSGIDDPISRFQMVESGRFSQAEMGSNPVSLRFIEFLIAVAGIGRVLEIGSFVGLSAISMAAAVPADGHVVTIERFPEYADIARQNIARNGMDGKVTLLVGDAFDLLPDLATRHTFDLAFIDGNKERYKEYFDLVAPMMSDTGIVLVDDCFFHGDALNSSPSTAKGRGVKAFLDYAATLEDWTRIALPISNGIYMLTRS